MHGTFCHRKLQPQITENCSHKWGVLLIANTSNTIITQYLAVWNYFYIRKTLNFCP